MLTWLHLSDLHLRENDRSETNTFLTDLLRDIEQRAVQGLKPDLVFVTGDLAFSGQRAQYDAVRAFLKRLAEVTCLPEGRLFVVPGNHDLDRARVSRSAFALVRDLHQQQSEEAIAALFEDTRDTSGTQSFFAPFAEYASF